MSETTDYDYNAAGKLEEKRDAKTQRIEYDDNDTTNQFEEIRYYDSAGVQTSVCMFSYDARSGLLSGYDDEVTSATSTYDDLGRKLSETVHYPGFSKTFSYTYYANGLKETFTMPDGTTYEYTGACPESVEGMRTTA